MSKKSPQLRFEGFTDDWELRKLGDEVKINGRIGFRGYTQADIVTKETGVLAYSPTNIVNNRLYRKQSDTYITKQKYRESPEIMVKNSDILFVKTGSTLGKSALVQSINYHATVNPQIVIIRSNELDEYFLSVILTSYNILKRINTIKIGGAIPTMTETELKKFPIQVPKSTEQKKIGSFFKQLDNTIALHQRKLDLLKEQKKGFLQKMFPKNGAKVPELRFAGFADDWEERKLDTIFNKIRNAFVGTATPYYVDAGHFYLESNNIKNGQINRDTEVFINDEFYNKQTDKLLHTGDIVMVQSGHVGHTAVIPQELDGTAAHALIMFTDYKEKTDSFFLNYQFQTYKSKIKLDKITTGNTIKHILSSEMKEFFIDYPSYEEQQKIGSFFKRLDATIALHQRKLDLLKEQKKGFLQKMFV